jgi:hypothetical protein
MDFRLYQAMQNELNLRANNETGKLFNKIDERDKYHE